MAEPWCGGDGDHGLSDRGSQGSHHGPGSLHLRHILLPLFLTAIISAQGCIQETLLDGCWCWMQLLDFVVQMNFRCLSLLGVVVYLSKHEPYISNCCSIDVSKWPWNMKVNWWWCMLQFRKIGKQSSWHFRASWHFHILKEAQHWWLHPTEICQNCPLFSFMGVASAGIHAIIIFVKQQNATSMYWVIRGDGRWFMVWYVRKSSYVFHCICLKCVAA